MHKFLLAVAASALLVSCGLGVDDYCNPTNCTGCCDNQGVCQSGISNNECGAVGNSCVACSPGMECASGFCQWPSQLSGSDAGNSVDGGNHSDAGSTSDGGLTSDAGITDGGCAPYQETPPNATASLAGFTYTGSNLRSYVLDVLGARYPLGKHLAQSAPTTRFDCIDLFASKSSQEAVLRSLGTVVHECGHVFDGELGGFRTNVYVIREDLRFSCQNGDTTARSGLTFARSLITQDAYSAKRPPCNGVSTANCDFYADTYLDGDPFDNQFDSGDQGFNLLLEEATQYVNSLATGYAFADQLGNSRVSEKDGLLTFMWYLERYLLMARTQYPQAYQFLSTDPCWREAIATVWQRGEFYLELTKNIRSLGISDVALDALVRDPALLAEMGPFLQCRK